VFNHILTRTAQDKKIPSWQIAATDEAIDKLVYRIYGLKEVEIKNVEGLRPDRFLKETR